jgi:hypothetical protein
MGAREVPHLRLPGTVIAGEFVDKHHRRAGAGLLIIKTGAIL